MRPDEQFARTIMPGTWYALGVRLFPLTLGHAIILQRLGSPFGCGGRGAGRGDVSLAIFVCSRPWRTAERQVGRWWVRWWLRLLPGWGNYWRVGLLEFLAYWRWFNREPATEVWRPPARGDIDDAPPILQSLKMFAMTHLSKSRDDAFDTPLNELLWDYVSWGVERGVFRLKTKKDRAVAEQLRAMKN
jgi:hypothetical protein